MAAGTNLPAKTCDDAVQCITFAAVTYICMKNSNKKSLTLKTLSKGNVWEVQENDIFRMWQLAEKDIDLKDNARHYYDIIRAAFDVEEIRVDKPEVVKKYEERGFKIGFIYTDSASKVKCAIKKRSIQRVTDLTYENIHHISAAQLTEVISRNFGGGWDSLSQSIQDIILSGFDISTTTLPKDHLHNKGGMYEKKVADGFDVLEIPKGTWVEAIFARAKPLAEKSHDQYAVTDDDTDDYDDNDEPPTDLDDSFDGDGDDSEVFDEESLMEESYRTTFEESPEDLSLDASDISDEDDY